MAEDFDIRGGTGTTRKLRVHIQSGEISINRVLTGISAEVLDVASEPWQQPDAGAEPEFANPAAVATALADGEVQVGQRVWLESLT